VTVPPRCAGPGSWQTASFDPRPNRSPRAVSRVPSAGRGTGSPQPGHERSRACDSSRSDAGRAARRCHREENPLPGDGARARAGPNARSDAALILHLIRKLVQPVKQRYAIVILLEEKDWRYRHGPLSIFAYLRTRVKRGPMWLALMRAII